MLKVSKMIRLINGGEVPAGLTGENSYSHFYSICSLAVLRASALSFVNMRHFIFDE